MVEGARLESVYTGNRIAGSNPASSAIRRFEDGYSVPGAALMAKLLAQGEVEPDFCRFGTSSRKSASARSDASATWRRRFRLGSA